MPVAGALIRVDARTGQVRKLADGRHAYLSLSPDGRTLAALVGIRMPRAASRDPARLDSVRHILHLIDLDTEEVSSPLPDLDIVSAGAIWSPTEAALTVFATEVGAFVSEGRHWRIDAQTGTARMLSHGGLDLVSERERGLLQRPERAYALSDGVAVFARPNADPADRSARFTYRDIASAGLARPDWYFLRPGSPPRILTRDLVSVTALPARIGAASAGCGRAGRHLQDPSGTACHPPDPGRSGPDPGTSCLRLRERRRGSLPAARMAMPPIEADRDGARIVLRAAAAASGLPAWWRERHTGRGASARRSGCSGVPVRHACLSRCRCGDPNAHCAASRRRPRSPACPERASSARSIGAAGNGLRLDGKTPTGRGLFMIFMPVC